MAAGSWGIVLFVLFLCSFVMSDKDDKAKATEEPSTGNDTTPANKTRTFEESYTPSTQVQQEREAYLDFEECVKEKAYQFTKGREKPILVLVQEGDTALLRCRICIQHKSYRSYMGRIQWMASLRINKYKEKPIFPNQRRLVLLRNFNLAFRPVSTADTGEYVCFNKDVHEALYRMDVLHKSVRRMVVQDGPPDLRPLESVAIENQNLMIFSNWEEWSQCSRCNVRGYRQRVGFCWVKKFHKDRAAAMPEMEKLFQDFPEGVPCFSSMAPKKLRELPEIKDRESETMVSFCRLMCPTEPDVRMFKNELGEVEEVVRKGYFSMKEKMPTLPPLAKRFFVYADEGENKVVICPDAKARNRANQIRWMIGYVEIDPLYLLRTSQGRIRIDLRNHLRIKSFQPSDVNTYSCWFGDKMLATIRVSMTEGRIQKFVFDICYGVAFLIAFLIVFLMSFKAFKGEGKVKNLR